MVNGSEVEGPSTAAAAVALAAELAMTRFVVQRVLMPIVIVFGVVANIINIAVLTRRSMKSSTNHYLSALALYDVLYLVLVLVIILHHYAAVASSRWYARYRPHVMWLGNTCSNTGVWLTVTFTVERYIGVCHPMRGKVWCTPKRARMIIAVVCFAAATITFPEFFEFQVISADNHLPTYAVQVAVLCSSTTAENRGETVSMLRRSRRNRIDRDQINFWRSSAKHFHSQKYL